MPEAIRVFGFARYLNLPSSVVIESALRLGFEVRSQLASLTLDQCRAIEEDLRSHPVGGHFTVKDRKLILIAAAPCAADEKRAGIVNRSALPASARASTGDRVPPSKVKQGEEIRSFCERRRIRKLVHFTRSDNLKGILSEGLLPRSVLESRPGRVIFNDQLRTDGHRDAVCLSVSFPNFRMFFKLRQQTQGTTWVVLVIRPEILWELDCAFCWVNAACSTMSRLPLPTLKTPPSLSKMFAEACELSKTERATCHIPDDYPTNPQAEVLVFSPVPLPYITGVCFETEDDLAKHPLPSSTSVKYEAQTALFRERSDWPLWTSVTH
jgi:hypothetical protein